MRYRRPRRATARGTFRRVFVENQRTQLMRDFCAFHFLFQDNNLFVNFTLHALLNRYSRSALVRLFSSAQIEVSVSNRQK